MAGARRQAKMACRRIPESLWSRTQRTVTLSGEPGRDLSNPNVTGCRALFLRRSRTSHFFRRFTVDSGRRLHIAERAEAAAHRRHRLLLCRPEYQPTPARSVQLLQLLVRASGAGEPGARAAGTAVLVGAGHPAVWRAAGVVEALAVSVLLALRIRTARAFPSVRTRPRSPTGLDDGAVADIPS